MDLKKEKNHIRSFVLRTGKITLGQKKALENLWPIYGVEEKSIINFESIFHNKKPVWLDIGFGNGESTIHAAKNHPEINLLGIEVHTPGIGHLLLKMNQHKLTNIRIIQNDAVDVLTQQIPDNSLAAIHIYFPDPWHKKRHHKRRLINEPFIQLMTEKLISNGRLHIATDWQPYAMEIQKKLTQFPQLSNKTASGFSQRPAWRPETKFERRGNRLNHNSYDLILYKN